MIIKQLKALEILNGQGWPTLQCAITLANNQVVYSSIPSGFAQKANTAHYAYDQQERFFKKGMLQAVDYINNTIAPMFIDKPLNSLAMDSQLIDLDTTPYKTTVGANITLVVSYAIFKAQAVAESIEPFELLQSLSGTKAIKIPTPIVSIIQGRSHNTQQDIKEFLLLPQEKSFAENLTAATLFHHHTHKHLLTQKQPTFVESFGSFVPPFTTQETFDLLINVLKTLTEYTYQIGLNVSACNIYNSETKTYQWNNKNIISDELISQYQKLTAEHPFTSYIQDGMAQSDQIGWQKLTNEYANITVAGDTVFGSNSMQIRKGIIQKISNTVIIRPEYIGTVSQTLAAIDACKKNGRLFIIASDQGQTSETFCSDIAVGTGANFIKAGSICRNEFVSKYNRILEIERKTLHSL